MVKVACFTHTCESDDGSSGQSVQQALPEVAIVVVAFGEFL